MAPLTRRTLLAGAAGLTAALAGCSGRGGSGGSTRTAPRDGDADGPTSGSTTDPATLLVRVDADRPPIWLAESDGDDRPTQAQFERWRDSIVVDGDARADRISVADTVDGDRVASFLAATDFDAETVFVDLGEVRACFELALCRIGWSATEISTDYARRSRPYTEHCAVDEWVIEARFVRIPDALDADDVHSYSSSIGTGVCDPQPDHAAAGDDQPTATATGTGTPTSGSGGEQ
ncbi:hypothetical protein [Halorubrum sp. SD683]|uniref:hypothetical protein n=1 Tax=Halorubrum sp. SD683 TaxID=1855873 RepID=UPI000A2EC0E7|nr:hypothetical protein [Halorubrum sp. SD683]OTF01918.1 hypothetical protein B9G49_01350 [Halorubrum sp. SD683]